MFASIIANLSAFQQLVTQEPIVPKEFEEPKEVVGSDEIDPEKRTTQQQTPEPPAAGESPVEIEGEENSEEQEDPEDPLIDLKAIDEAVLETMLPNLTAIDESIDVSSIKSVDDFIPVFKKTIEDQIKNDPDFKNKLKAEIVEELGIDDHTIEQVTGVKKGIDIKRHRELSQMEKFVDLDFETPDEIQKLFQVYYNVNKTNKSDAERLLALDMNASPEELAALVNERKQSLKDYVSTEFQSLETNRNDAVLKIEASKAEVKKKVDEFLTSKVIGGQRRSQEEIDLYLEMTAPGTTEIVLPTGEKKMVSRYQAHVFKKESDVDSFFPELFQNVLDVANNIADIKEKVRRNSVAKGAFAKNLAKNLSAKGFSGGIVKKGHESSLPASSKSNEEAFNEIISKK